MRYSPAAVMDAYEVLREIIDDTEQLPGLFAVVLADSALATGDPRRALSHLCGVADARLAGVRPGDRQNPVAPLVLARGMRLEAAPRSRRCGPVCQTGPPSARWAPSKQASRTPSKLRWP